MAISNGVQKIKEKLSIVDVISSYIKLDRAGINLKAKCPFHNEKTPSFFVSPARGSYYCFGCGASGDIFTFVEEFEGLDFKGALKLLADRAGVELEVYSRGRKEDEGEKEKLYRIMEEATRFFENNLEKNAEAREYLKSRGLTEKTVKDFRIGFAILDWRNLYDYLKSKNFSDKEIEQAGLAKRPDQESGKPEKAMYDRFRGRIIFPISDSSGRVIAFSGRLLESVPTTVGRPTDSVGPKYLNSPDTPIFKKSSILYGLDKAKQAIRKNDFSIIVEGQFDLILSHQTGFRNTVATSGTALADSDRSPDDIANNLGIISHLSPNIVFVFDGDKAGLAASERATPIGLALFKDMNVKAAMMPIGADPADLISTKGVDAWREVIRNAKHIIEFLVDRYITDVENIDSLKIQLNIEKKIIPYLELIQNPIKKSHFISMIANKSGMKEEDIREILNRNAKANYQNNNYPPENTKSNRFRKDYILRKLLGIILWQKTLPETSSETSIDFNDILKEIADILNITPEEVLDPVSRKRRGDKTIDDDADLIFEAEVFYGEGANVKKDADELLSNLREEYLKDELALKMRELNIAEEKGDKEKAMIIFQECQILNQKIQDIKNGRLK